MGLHAVPGELDVTAVLEHDIFQTHVGGDGAEHVRPVPGGEQPCHVLSRSHRSGDHERFG